jgi:threonine synthase
MWNIGTTFDYNVSEEYQNTLTRSKPDDSWLWFRLPDSIRWCLSKEELNNLEHKVKSAFSLSVEDSGACREIIKEVFVDLWVSLETWFTREQIEDVVSGLDSFSDDLIVPIEELGDNNYLLNEFYGPTGAFKDIALQMLTYMVSIVVEEQNKASIQKAKEGERWQKLRFLVNLTSTSWDTWPASGAGIEWKKFVVNVIGFPAHESTFSQIWQMVALKDNVLAIPMKESFSDIQSAMVDGNNDEYKAELLSVIQEEFSDLIEKYGFEIEVDSGSFNSINPGRIDGQMVYHTYWLLQARARGIIKDGEEIIEVVPSGNGGHVYSVLQARLMGKVDGPTIVTCNKNDMFYKIFEEGRFKKIESDVHQASVSMIIQYPNNMIRLFSYAFWPIRAKEISDTFFAGKEVVLSVTERKILREKLKIYCYRIESEEELKTVSKTLLQYGKLVCPHTANALAWLKKYRDEYQDTDTPALVSETASPWKFLAASGSALGYNPDSQESMMKLYDEFRKKERTKEWCVELLDIINKRYMEDSDCSLEGMLPGYLSDIYTNWYELPEVRSAENFHDDTLVFVKEYVPMLKRQVGELLKES